MYVYHSYTTLSVWGQTEGMADGKQHATQDATQDITQDADGKR